MVKRWVAYKMAIMDIVESDYKDGAIQFGNLQINRVRVMGTVVSKFISDDKNYGFFVLDDGTETIRVRAFDNINLIEKVKVGDVADVVGRIRKYEDEIYVLPEIVVKIEDPNWIFLRKLELIRQKMEIDVEEEIVETPKQKIMRIIKELDKGDGVDVSVLNKEIGDEKIVEDVLTELKNEGEIFEPRVGKVKLLW